MKYGIPVAVAVSLLVGGSFAQAQTSPSTTTTPSTNMPAVTAPAPTVGPNGGALGANRVTTPAQISNSPAPASVSTTSAPSRTTAAPVAGANSFTEGEARHRIEEKGFGQVAGLKKDSQGIWRGTAMKDGKSMAVALDYQGNVVGQ